MNNHILIRNALLGSWNVGSEYIRLCGNEKFETPDELSSRFNINVLLQTLFREPSEFSAELLMESYLNAQNGDEGNQLFLRAFKIDDEYAVSIDEHIYLRKLVKKTDEPYAPPSDAGPAAARLWLPPRKGFPPTQGAWRSFP